MKRVVQAIQEIIAASVDAEGSPLSNIKNVIFGEPVDINRSSLPAICITGVRTTYSLRGSRYDEKIRLVEIKIIYSAENFFSKDSGDSFAKVDLIEKLYEQMETEDSDHSTAALSVCGLIQNNPKLPYSGGYASESARIIDVNYLWFNDLRWTLVYSVVATAEVRVIGNR